MCYDIARIIGQCIEKDNRMGFGESSQDALDRINQSPIDKLLITDTIPLKEKTSRTAKIKVFSVAGLLAEGIQRIHNEDSVSELFV